MNRAESELTNPSIYAQINKDIEQKVQIFTGDSAASNPSRLSVAEPIKPVLDVGSYQVEGLHILDSQGHSGSNITITLDSFNDANTGGRILERINKAQAWQFANVGFLFSCTGGIAIDMSIRGTYAVDGGSPNVSLYNQAMTPAFPLSSRYLNNSVQKSRNFTGNDFMITAADPGDGLVKKGNLIALVVEFRTQGGSVTYTIDNLLISLNLFY
jgi:hypothetical protein